MYSEQYYRTLAFLAGFGAAGALGCEAVMEEENYVPEPSANYQITAAFEAGFRRDTGRKLETITEE